jgi:hypothetical protein
MLLAGMLMAGAGAAISTATAGAGLALALLGGAFCAGGAWRMLRR